MTIEYLKRGHKVIYAIKISDYSIATIKEWESELKNKGITVKKIDDHFEIEGFVSGDTIEDGLSVVALDNTEVCLVDWRTGNDVREKCRTGRIIKSRKLDYRSFWNSQMSILRQE